MAKLAYLIFLITHSSACCASTLCLQVVLLPAAALKYALPVTSLPLFQCVTALSLFQVFRALGGVNGEKRRGGLHLARPKSPNMQELKRRFRQVLSSRVKSATTLWVQDKQHNKWIFPLEERLKRNSNTPAWKIKASSPLSCVWSIRWTIKAET